MGVAETCGRANANPSRVSSQMNGRSCCSRLARARTRIRLAITRVNWIYSPSVGGSRVAMQYLGSGVWSSDVRSCEVKRTRKAPTAVQLPKAAGHVSLTRGKTRRHARRERGPAHLIHAAAQRAGRQPSYPSFTRKLGIREDRSVPVYAYAKAEQSNRRRKSTVAGAT